MKKQLLIIVATLAALAANAQSRWGAAIYANPGTELALDSYTEQWLKKQQTFSLGAEMLYSPLPQDSSLFDRDYNYPTLAVGLRYCDNSRVRMHRDPSPDWGLAEEVNYDSHLGDTWSLYLRFARPIVRTRRWSAEYSMATGIGYSHLIYNNKDDIDNELIGSHLNIYLDLALNIAYQLTDDYALRLGLDYYHHSNGALARPNKGANVLGPSLALVWFPGYSRDRLKSAAPKDSTISPTTGTQRGWSANLAVNIGGKTLLEDWQRTQFGTPSTSPDYRTDHFTFYTAYALRADLTYRYARRWATGLGLDLYYGSYADHVRQMDEADGSDVPHSPWSVGIALKHQAYYGNLSVALSLGWYLYREMGVSARVIEQPYYESIGLRYTLSRLGHLQVGAEVFAHRTKADFTALVLSYPIWRQHPRRK